MPLDCRTTTSPVTVRFVLRCDGVDEHGPGAGCPTGAEAELRKELVGFLDGHPAWRPGRWLYFVERIPDCGGLNVKRCLCPACAEVYAPSSRSQA